jgi:hypothetical protein
MDREFLINYILKNSETYKRTELKKMSTRLLVIVKVQVEIEIEEMKKLKIQK